MGGSGSHEFMAPSAAGRGRRRALRRRAATRPTSSSRAACPSTPAAPDWSARRGGDPGRPHHRGGVGVPRDRSRGSPSSRCCSSRPTRPVLALVRGDHALHERKLARALGEEARPAHPEEVAAAPRRARRARSGRSASRGVTRILADESLREGRYVVGANREGFHLAAWRRAGLRVRVRRSAGGARRARAVPSAASRSRSSASSRSATSSSSGRSTPRRSARCTSTSRASSSRSSWAATASVPRGSPPAAIEQRHDADGIVWPWAIAPFQVHLVPVGGQGRRAGARPREEIYGELRAAGFDVLLDDRDERAGVKFKDADLLGVPDPGHRRATSWPRRAWSRSETRRAPRRTSALPRGQAASRPCRDRRARRWRGGA